MSLYIPKIIGHRGAKGYAPENTLSSLHSAADMGIEWVEFDVKLTKDQVPIIFHDDTLDRTTNSIGPVAEKTLAELKELDAGSWFSESFIGESIPTLEEALEVIMIRGMGCNIELKPCPGREVETAEAALDIATTIWPEEMPAPLISSFQLSCLETAQDMVSGWPRGYLIDYDEQDGHTAENWQEKAKYIDAATINCNGNQATRENIEDYINSNRPVLCYTINDPAKAQELLEWGVTSFFSDVPDVIREELESYH